MEVYFYLSSDVQYNVMVKIHCITGLKFLNILEQQSDYYYSATTCSSSYECYIEAELYNRTGAIGLPICSSYKQFNSGWNEWNEWIKFPVFFNDISRETQIVFTLYAVSPIIKNQTRHVLGGVTLPLFEQRILRYGRHKLRLSKNCIGDGNIDSNTLFSKLNRQLTVKDQLEAVLTMKLMRKIPQVPWLDALTNRRLLKISNTNNKTNNQTNTNTNNNNNNIYLYIDLPNLGYHIVYQEKAKGKKFIPNNKNIITKNFIYDPEIRNTNPIVELNKKLSKHLVTANVRPNRDEMNKLLNIINYNEYVYQYGYNYNELNEDNRELLWKFRNYLIDNSRALCPFLRCVNQSSSEEINIAMDLIDKWREIDISDALELLSGNFINSRLRGYGINVLRNNASDKDLELYIMQLVQAIRFENSGDNNSHNSDNDLAELSLFLLNRSLNSHSFRLLNFLYWSVVVASKSEAEEDIKNRKYSYFLTKIEIETQKIKPKYFEEIERQKLLINSLIELSQYIYTNVKGRAEDKERALKNVLSPKGLFAKINKQLMDKPCKLPLRPEIRVCLIDYDKCSVFRSALCPFLLTFKIYRQENNNNNNNNIQIEEKEGKKQENNNNNNNKKEKEEMKHQYLDLENDEYYKIIWKNGDDLRQDQLIIQMINIMDNLLLDVNLNLSLTPYPVLATGLNNGMLECVPNSASIANILKKYDDNISLFIGSHSNKPNLLSKNVSTFVKSCAGYCVITFLLGVGDRHLDNLLITKNGHLFHIDFGFIYGDDPKPWPPPMKICKQMIDAMGGYNSHQYKQFQQHMTSCYNELRKKAPLIMNLLSLMGQGSIQEIQENVNYVYSKFRLDLNSEQAQSYLNIIMEESVNALFTKVVDKIHDWATYWR